MELFEAEFKVDHVQETDFDGSESFLKKDYAAPVAFLRRRYQYPAKTNGFIIIES